MQVKIHERKAARARHEILAIVCGGADSTRLEAVEYSLTSIHEPLVRTNEKTSSAACRIEQTQFRQDVVQQTSAIECVEIQEQVR